MSKNTRVFLALAVIFLAGTLIFAGGPKRKILLPGAEAPKPYADSEVLVKFKEGVSLDSINQFAAKNSLIVKKKYGLISKLQGQQLVLLKSIEEIDSQVLAQALKANPNIEYAHPNYFRQLAIFPNDANFGSLWGMNNTGQTGGTFDADIDAPEAWDISTGSSSVIVAVIDSGLDYKHPDLAPNCWKNPGEVAGNGIDDDGNGYVDDVYGIDPCGAVYTENIPDTDPMDVYGHGTHCAGSIGARGNNSLGVVGVNWNVKIMGLKFFDDAEGGGADADSIECIQYAVYQKTHGQNIVAINASWGSTGGTDSGSLRDAIEVANNAGIVFCAAAGNGGSDGVGDNNEVTHHYPSDYTLPGIISVAATDHNDARATFSNYGATSVDLGAPGVSILSTVPRKYYSQSGDIFFDNVEGGVGNWVTSGTNNTWARTTNQEVFSNPSFPVPSPTQFWSDSPGANYARNTNSYLSYNANINLSGYSGQDIYFGFGTAAYIQYFYDHCYIEFSSNGGSAWTRMYDFTGFAYYWSYYSFLIPESFKTSQFRMRFHFTSNNTTHYNGCLIDNIGIGFPPAHTYESWDGTSMAAPHVSGAVAYLASIYPNETVAQRKERILQGGDPVSSLSGITVTGRRLNLFGAYSYTPSAQPSINVTSPNGGEVWMIGTAHNITWSWNGTVGNVDIAYSLNSGVTWTSIVANTANDGTHSWTVPAVTPSTNCLIRVWGITDHDPSDTSDAVFTITANTTETVTAPTTPTGPATGTVGASFTYTTGGSVSSLGHSVQYRFDWGDGTLTNWLAVGTTSASHSWPAAGTYNVRAMARCSTHWIQSAWSPTLPVTQDETPTWAGISRFAACASESQPTVEWHTASELSPVGFNLWRRDLKSGQFERVNPSLLPALPNSPRGGVYRLADPGAFSGEPMVYRLEEIDSRGRTHSYGPFTVVFGTGRDSAPSPEVQLGGEEPSGVYGYQRFPRGRSLDETERLKARRLELQKNVSTLAAVKSRERVRITVRGRGLFYIASAQIAASLGIHASQAEALVAQYRLKMTSMGREIAWLADAGGAGIFFYNPGLATPFSDRNIYWLEQGSGLAMETVGGGNAGPADPGQSFRETLHLEGNGYALLGAFMNPLGDIWFWDYVEGGAGAKSFAVDIPAAVTSGTATLTVNLQGATDTEGDLDHHAVVSLNGTEIGGSSWDGTRAHSFVISFDASLLREGGNAISVSGLMDTGAPYSVFYVASFDLSYQRYYRAAGNSLICRGDGHSAVTISGITELQVVVLDLDNPIRPRQLAGVSPDVSGRVTFVPRAAARDYLLSGLNAAQRPLAVVGDRPAQLKGPAHSAEYIVIAPEEFAPAAQELADYRKARGLKAVVVTLEDIYEAFNFGAPSPLAIREFLAHAYSKWSGRKVKYAVLAGKGTYDYNDYLKLDDNRVPALLAKTEFGLCAADRIFGDVTGKDGLPEIAIGRLPTVSGGELRGLIAKIKAYESGQGAWTSKALLIADNADDGGDFALGSNELASLALGFQVEKKYLNGSAPETRAAILAAWNAGTALVNYCGHAGLDQLAAENIFNVSDARALSNGGMLPLSVMLTCVAGRFELPGFTCLNEALLLNGDGGSAGGLAPSGAAMHADSMRLGAEFYRAALLGKGATAGQALLAAMKNYLLQGGPAYLLNVYNWLGDPALSFK